MLVTTQFSLAKVINNFLKPFCLAHAFNVKEKVEQLNNLQQGCFS